MSVCVWLWCVSVPSLPALSCLTQVINELKAMVVIKRRSKKGSCLLPSYPQAEAAPLKDQGPCEEDDCPIPDAAPEHDSGSVEQGGPDDTCGDSLCSSGSGDNIRVKEVSADALKWLEIH